MECLKTFNVYVAHTHETHFLYFFGKRRGENYFKMDVNQNQPQEMYLLMSSVFSSAQYSATGACIDW
jgi:hypothetical protein